MRILTVSHFYEAHGGGIERVAGHLCRQFAARGHAAAWAASAADPSPPGPIEAVPLGCLNPTERLTGLPMPLPRPGAMRALARQVALADAVVVHDALYVTSILAMRMAKRRGKRVVLIQHIAGIPFRSRLLRGVMRLANAGATQPMLRAADEVVFISDTVREDLIGRDASRSYRLVFNGVDEAIFHPAHGVAPVPASVARLDLTPGSRNVLFVGRTVEKKGLSVLRAVAAARPNVNFLLAGSGPIRPTSWGLANVYDLGPQTPENLAQLYRWADLLLLPSVGEGFPLVVQESMACGLPVICGTPTERADPDAATWLRGVAIDLADVSGSARRCVDAIDSFVLTPQQRVEMSVYAVRRYDWRSMADAVIAAARGPAAEPATASAG